MDADQPAELKVCKQIEDVERSEHGLVMSVGRLADLQPATVNINKSDVHFGDKFITQNVTTTDDFRGRAGAWRCRGSVLVCVCWAGVLAAALSAVLLLLLLSNNHRLDIEAGLCARMLAGARSTSRAERGACAGATGALLLCAALAGYFLTRPDQPPPDVAPAEWYLTRDMWLARAHDESRAADPYPLRLVVVHHSVSNECRRFIACAAELRNLQGYFLDKFEYDIPYNFLIGNDGRVYEGRGWGVEGAHTRGYNRCTLGIGFIGDYRESTIKTKVTATQVNRTQMLLAMGVKLGYLDPNYVVVGGKDVQATASPGDILYASLETWPHYDAARFRGLDCDQIREANLDNDTTIQTEIPTTL